MEGNQPTTPPAASAEGSDPAAEPDAPLLPGEELVDRRTENAKFFATDGEGLRVKVYSRAVHFRDGDGRWQDIDPSLRPVVGGRHRSAANSVAVELDEDPRAPVMARLVLDGEHSVGFGLAGARPGRAAVRRSDLTYRAVMPHVDLELASRVGELKETLVLHSASAPDSYLFPLKLEGLTAEARDDGSLAYLDETGTERLVSPPGFMTDSSGPGAEGEVSTAVRYSLEDTGPTGIAVRLDVDRAWLDDPARVYPVRVDPTYIFPPPRSGQDDTYVATSPSANRSDWDWLAIGHKSGDPSGRTRRSYLHFDVSGLSGKGYKVTAATLNMVPSYAPTCTATSIDVHRVNQAWSGSTMTAWPGASYDATALSRQSVSGGASGCMNLRPVIGGGTAFTSMIQNWVDNSVASPNYGLMVKAAAEGDTATASYKEFHSYDAAAGGSLTPPELDMNVSLPPHAPSELLPTGDAASGLTPTLSAKHTDPDYDAATVYFYVYPSTGTSAVASGSVTGISSGSRSSWAPPALAEGKYRFRAYARDAWASGPFSSYSYFTVDPTAPGGVTISSSSHPSSSSWYANRTLNASWTAASDATSGVAGYGVVVDQSASTVPATRTHTGTTSTTTVAGDGQWYLHVRAQDRAGNWGPVAHFGFRVDTVAPGTPAVSSSTHPDPAKWYNNNDPALSWSASDPSGIGGWSYVLDQVGTTTPDTTSEGTATTTSYADVSDGTWWFHVRARDGAGNWGPTAHFRLNIETAAGAAPVVSSSTHPDQDRWYSANDPALSWTNASASGVSGHSYALDQSPSTTPDTASEGTVASASFPDKADGVWYFHVRSLSGAGVWSNTAHFRLRIDTAAPGAPSALRSTSHLRGVSSPDRTVDMAWANDATDTSGVVASRWSFTSSEAPPTSGAGETRSAGTTATSGELADGVYWFHVRGEDAAGNIGAYASFGPVVIDGDAGLILPSVGLDPVAASDGLGLEQFAPYDDHDLGAATGYVNLGNGNLVVVDDDAHIDAQGLNVVARRAYNSQRGADSDDGLGRGWNLSVGDASAGLEGLTGAATDLDLSRPLAIADLGDVIEGVYQVLGQVLEFSDADGTTHRFVRRGGPGGRWDSPPGVDLRVVEQRNVLGLVVAYDLVRPDGVTYRAENISLLPGIDLPSPTWRLTQVSDRNDNRISYTYGHFGRTAAVRLAEVAHNRRPGPLVRLTYDANANLDTMVTLPDLVASDPATGVVRPWARTTDFTVEAAPGLAGTLGEHRLASVVDNAHLPVGDPSRRTTSYAYHDDSTLAGVTDPRGATTALRYEPGADAAPRLRFLDDRRAKTSEWRYGAPAGDGSHVTTALSPLGVATTYTVSARAAVSAADPRIAGANVVAITDPGTGTGPVTTGYAWSANRMVASTDGAGATTRFRYNDLGLLSEATLPSPNAADAPSHATVHHGEVRNTLSYSFLSPGGAYDGCDPAAAPANPDISAEGYCATVAELDRVAAAANVAAQVRISDFDYDAAGNLTRTIERATPSLAQPHDAPVGPDDRASATAYHPASGGLVASVDGPRTDVADVTRYGAAGSPGFGYDTTGNPTTITDAADKTTTLSYRPYGQVAAEVDRDGHRRTWAYDERDNLLRHTDAEGQATSFAYDANDNATSATSPRGNASPAEGDFTTTWAYDGNDWMTSTSTPGAAGGPRTVVGTAYHDDGTLASTTSARGATTTYGYWDNRALRTVDAPAADGARALTETFYDTAGRPSRTLAPVTNAAGARPETVLAYAPSGAPSRLEETSAVPGPRTTRTGYNAHGEPVVVEGPRSIGGVVASTTSAYDAFGQVRLMRRRAGAERWLESATGYDLAGNPTTVSQPTGTGGQLSSTYAFDAVNRMAAQTADPHNPGHTVEFAYDGEGTQTLRRDLVNGAATRVTTTTPNPDDTLQSQVATDYDPATGLATATLAACHYGAGAPPTSGYDADGNRTETRTLTVAGSAGDPCASGQLQRRQSFTYDERGWMGASTQEVRSPETGAMVARDQTYAYDPDGARASLAHSTPGGPSFATTYASTEAGWAKSATDWRAKVSTVSYFPSGAPSARTLDSGVASAGLGWHPDGMVAEQTWRNGAGTVLRAHTAIGYDSGGLRSAEHVSVRQPGGTTSAGTARYGHDLLGRLDSWTSPFADPGAGEALSTAYGLDDGGNITTATTTGATTATTYATVAATYPNGRLDSRSVTAGGTTTESFSYDGLGQEVLRQGGQVPSATAYDPMGHPATVDDRSASNADVSFVHAADDRLIARTEAGAPPERASTTLYFYWGATGTLVEEADGTGKPLVRYLNDATGRPLAQQSYRVANGHADPSDAEGTWRWLLADADGNVATHVLDSGEVAEQVAFDPYGKPEAAGSSSADPAQRGSTLGFQGAITDRATGSVVLGPRHYDPTTARFTTPDTFVSAALDLQLGLDPLTGNRYLFAGANPVAFFDDGHAPREQLYREGKPYPAPKKASHLSKGKPRAPKAAPVSVGRRPPTPDGFCWGDLAIFIDRRSDGRCKGANPATDWLVGSDSTKDALDPNYESVFLNAERRAGESGFVQYFVHDLNYLTVLTYVHGCLQFGLEGSVVGGYVPYIGPPVGAAIGCGAGLVGAYTTNRILRP